MVTKTVMAVVALAMLASTAQATYMMDKFEALLDEPSLDTLVDLMVWQTWAFLAPFVGGPLKVWLNFLWYGGTTIDAGGETVIWPVALGFLGIGNFPQLYTFFMGIIPILIGNTLASDLSLGTKMAYSTAQTDVLDKLGITAP